MFLTRIRQSAAFASLLRLLGLAATGAPFGIGPCSFPGTSKFKSAVDTAARGSPS